MRIDEFMNTVRGNVSDVLRKSYSKICFVSTDIVEGEGTRRGRFYLELVCYKATLEELERLPVSERKKELILIKKYSINNVNFSNHYELQHKLDGILFDVTKNLKA